MSYIYSITIIYILIRLALYGTGYFMTPDIDFYGGASDYLAVINIKNALNYHITAYELKVFSFINYSIYILLCLSPASSRHSRSREYGPVNESKYKNALFKNKYFSAALKITDFYVGAVISCFPYHFMLGYFKEKSFGFLNLNITDWLLLYIKQFAINLFTTIFIYLLIFFLLSCFQNKWRAILSLSFLTTAFIFIILIQFIITPFFYHITSLKESSLKNNLLSIAANYGIDVHEIKVIDESRYSNRTNAFFVGFGPWKKIYLCDTLFKANTIGEIEAIFAHELGHYFYNHVFRGIIIASASAALFFYITLFIPGIKKIDGSFLADIMNHNVIKVLIIFQALYFFSLPAQNYISRTFERAADNFALKAVIDYKKKSITGYDSSEAVNNQKKLLIQLAKKNLSTASIDRFNYFFFATHPAIIERMANSDRYLKQ